MNKHVSSSFYKGLILSTVVIVALGLSGCVEPVMSWGNAPDFTLTTIDDTTFTLSDYLGRVVVLDFMATWCGPCKIQMQELNKAYPEMGNNTVILSIAPYYETAQEIRDIYGDYVDKWFFASDTLDEKVDEQYTVDVYPTLYIIDIHGNISFSSGTTGVIGKDQLLTKIEMASS